MHVLFVHPNSPAQFRHVAPRLAADYGWDCTFATNNTRTPDLPGVRRVVYRPPAAATAAAVLLAGKPVVLVPLVLEQRLTAAAVERLGAGAVAAPSSTRETLAGKLDAVATEPGYAAAAGRLAAKNAAFDPAAQVGRMVERVEAIMVRGARTKRERGSVFAG